MSGRLTIREAAARSGLSVPTLRRRIRAGVLVAVMVPGPYGDQWEIPVECLEEQDARLSILGEAPDADQGMVRHPDPDGLPDQGSISLHDRQAGEYWRGRWEEQREAVQRLERLLEQALAGRSPVEEAVARPPGADLPSAEDDLRDALRARTQELAHARNVIDSLRREKARWEAEAGALRDQVRRLRSGLGSTLELAEPAEAWRR